MLKKIGSPSIRACFLLAYLLIAARPLWSEVTKPAPVKNSLHELIQLAERRSRGWIAFKANLKMEFVNSGGESAFCNGDLFYQRLDEKILLKCLSDEHKLLFIFKTQDQQFELYLPASKTVYRGDIFSLEFSPDVESHLKPLDLYRALKPFAIPEDRAELEKTDPNGTTVDILSEKDHQRYLSRQVLISPEGDIRFEKFFNPEEAWTTLILRSEYKSKSAAADKKITFPHHLEIQNPSENGTNKVTRLSFQGISFFPSIGELDWTVSYPPDTKSLTL